MALFYQHEWKIVGYWEFFSNTVGRSLTFHGVIQWKVGRQSFPMVLAQRIPDFPVNAPSSSSEKITLIFVRRIEWPQTSQVVAPGKGAMVRYLP